MLLVIMILIAFVLCIGGPLYVNMIDDKERKLAESQLQKELEKPKYCIKFMVSSSNAPRYTDTFEPTLYHTSKEIAEQYLNEAFYCGKLVDVKEISYPMCNVIEAQVIKFEE